MDGVATIGRGGLYYCVGIQVGGRPNPVQRNRFIGFAGMQTGLIVFRVDRYGVDTQFCGRTENPHRHFAAIGNKQFHLLIPFASSARS